MNRVRVGVAAVIQRDGKILLIRRKNVHGAGTWSTPGGHLEFQETPEACAVRETREEVGIEIERVRFLAITNDVFTDRARHYITIWMQADYCSGEAGVAAEHEIAEVGWFDWDALPEPLFLPFENFLHQKSYPPEGFRMVTRTS